MLTNGYHPLWMMVCVVAAWITTESAALIQILSTVQDLLLLGSIAVIASMARTAKIRGAVFGCVPLVFFGMVLGIWRLLISLCIPSCVFSVYYEAVNLLVSSRVLTYGARKITSSARHCTTSVPASHNDKPLGRL